MLSHVIPSSAVALLAALSLLAAPEGATASRTPRRASKRDRARESMLSWTAVMGSILVH